MKREELFDESRMLGVRCTKCEWMASTGFRIDDPVSRKAAEKRLRARHALKKPNCKQPEFEFNR